MKNSEISKKRIAYLLAFIILLLIEISIALFMKDKFIRPYVGDMLVVIVLYCMVKSIIPKAMPLLPLYIFIFATFVEFLQYINVVELLGWSGNAVTRIVVGTSFDWRDVLCYLFGCVLLAIGEKLYRRGACHKPDLDYLVSAKSNLYTVVFMVVMGGGLMPLSLVQFLLG